MKKVTARWRTQGTAMVPANANESHVSATGIPTQNPDGLVVLDCDGKKVTVKQEWINE